MREVEENLLAVCFFLPPLVGVLCLNADKMGLSRIVVKFGGSSLADGSKISKAAETIVKEAEKGTEIAVVVSAMGRTTDHLIATAEEACGGNVSGRDLDDIMSMGERTSARIFTAALKSKGLKSRLVDPSDPEWPIITDGSFTKAKPILHLCDAAIKTYIQPLLERGIIPVVPGFIGRTQGGAITTMGRGGSDVTAFVLARGLQADQVILVTDVEGIRTADPKLVKGTRKLDEVSVDVLVGLTDTGAKFIHKKALKYKSPSIDIKVIKNTSGNLRSEGTIIRGCLPRNMVVDTHPRPVMAVTVVGKAISESPKVIYRVLKRVRESRAEILGMSINQNSLILYLPITGASERLLEDIHSIVVEEETAIAMALRRDLALIKVRDVGLEETPGVISDIADALRSSSINIYGIFTITSSVILFVDQKDKDRAIHLVKDAVKANSS